MLLRFRLALTTVRKFAYKTFFTPKNQEFLQAKNKRGEFPIHNADNIEVIEFLVSISDRSAG